MIFFKSAADYIGSKCSNIDRAAAVDAIITALMIKASEVTGDANIQEYWLNDGQTQIKAIYRSQKEIMTSIESYERLKQMYLNRAHGRMIRLMPSNNFPG